MSEALRSLEASLRQPLFDRANRRLRLNAAGKAFLKDARILLTQSDALYRRHVGRPRLVCGASVTVGNYILPPILIELVHHHPDLYIDLVIRNTQEIAQMVVNREVQAAVVEGRVADAQLESVRWREDELVIIAPPAHPLTKGATLERLAEAPWILREPGSGTRESFDAATASWPVPPRITMTAGGNEIIKQAVAAGLGLSCLSRAAVHAEIERGELALLATEQRMVRTLTFLRRHDSVRDSSLTLLIEGLGLETARSI